MQLRYKPKKVDHKGFQIKNPHMVSEVKRNRIHPGFVLYLINFFILSFYVRPHRFDAAHYVRPLEDAYYRFLEFY